MTSRSELHVDIETYSSVDLKTAGVHRYVESPDFEILLFGYAYGMAEPVVIDLAQGEVIPDYVLADLTSPDRVKVAHNCDFERTCLARWYYRTMPADQWEDTQHLAAMHGLPQSLEEAGAALNLEQQKLQEGKRLIDYFCKPCRATVANGGRTRNLPSDSPEKWERFKYYNKRDVVAEQGIYFRLADFPIPLWERKVRCLDADINERGVLVDLDLAKAATEMDAINSERFLAEMQKLTGLSNPDSVAQLKGWLRGCGYNVDTLRKTDLADLLADCTDPVIRRVLELRAILGKTSTAKYTAMLTAASPVDHRIRGMMKYYGAGRTGRWAGRIVQPQNLPQNHLANIAEVRELVRSRDYETLSMLFDNVPDVLSQLIRTALIAKQGYTFLVADYSAIEARVIAYLAGEQWRMDVFANGGDIYCSSASQMFKVPVVKHGINGHLRQKGKIAELACGYGGGSNALKAFGADKMGLSEAEMQAIVTQWRAASPAICRFWREAEGAAKSALAHPGKSYRLRCGCSYRRDADAIRLQLPSGRVLSYWQACLEEGEIRFMAQDQSTKTWRKSSTWGGKLVENIVQAYARDCLAVAMLRLDAAGFRICFSVHDEVICEEPKDGRSWKDMADIMGLPISWAPGLLLRGDGYQTDFYMKD
ncbi:MAG: DNA polymerase [Oscillospiraceae bacterium]|nr:DNA polymerase [Oscillospiraceae bacterium]